MNLKGGMDSYYLTTVVGLRRALIALLIVAALTSIVWIPALVFAVEGEPDKFQYYLKALEAIVSVHVETLKKIIELFKTAVSG